MTVISGKWHKLASATLGAAFLSVPLAVAMALVAWFGTETRGRDLRELED